MDALDNLTGAPAPIIVIPEKAEPALFRRKRLTLRARRLI